MESCIYWEACRGLTQVPCNTKWLSVLLGFLMGAGTVSSSCLLTGPFASYRVASSSHDLMVCLWSQYSLLYHIWLRCLGYQSFLRGDGELRMWGKWRWRDWGRRLRRNCSQDVIFKRVIVIIIHAISLNIVTIAFTYLI